MSSTDASPARAASDVAFRGIEDALTRGSSFVLEAGAGAGKTYSLIETLQYLIAEASRRPPARHQRIACITYTNVATDEIRRRIDEDPLVMCSTIHGFCWKAIEPFQQPMRRELPGVGTWSDRIEKKGIPIERQRVSYELGLPTIREDRITLGHADVPKMFVQLMEHRRFRELLVDRFPVILIDEYQDSDKQLVRALLDHFVGTGDVAEASGRTPLLGFFGDHWQQIYPGTCGAISAPGLERLEKGANFRSTPRVVDVLNHMRPELKQVADRRDEGVARVWHTNDWPRPADVKAQWAGDLDREHAHDALELVRAGLGADPLEGSSESPKILMLTHRVLGSEQGYSDLVACFQDLEGLSQLEDPHVAYFARVVEPACEAYEARRYGRMFDAVRGQELQIRGSGDKRAWNEAMDRLLRARETGSVKAVIDVLDETRRPALSDVVDERERSLKAGEPPPSSRHYADLNDLHEVPYEQVRRFVAFNSEHSPFATKHGVKGAEFDDVLVVASRGWNNYDFNAMLEWAADESALSSEDRKRLMRNRNLFYVACSRARRRLTVLFTHELSDHALETLRAWFGEEDVRALPQPTAPVEGQASVGASS